MLTPAPDQPGLWLADDWTEGMPGVYALIVGVSHYPHLEGGERPAPETYGLGQLPVSARTAAAVFHWLKTQYHREGLPIVWCRLLLSPTPHESAAIADLGIRHYARPTYHALAEAIEQWSANLPRRGTAAASSRSLFFFSGHGVQSNWAPLLLPSDYLGPPFAVPRLQNCISARELRQWMETHPAGEHLALIDACRNEFSPLAHKGATAHTTFEAIQAAETIPRAVATLSAAAPTRTAYQRHGDDYSFFGRAVLESLESEPDDPLLGKAGEMLVEFLRLVRRVKPRVNALLKEVGAQVEQTAFPTLQPADAELILTQFDPQPNLLAPSRSFIDLSGDAQRVVDERFTVVDTTPTPIAALRNFASAHKRFGHEGATDVWAPGRFHIHDLRDGSLIEDDENIVMVTRTERDEDSLLVRVDLELRSRPDAAGLLLVFDGTGDVAAGRLAVPVPTDPGGVMPLRLTLTLTPSAGGQIRLQRVEARLGPSVTNPYYQDLWELLQLVRFGSFADAAKVADPGRLMAAVADKQSSPTAAIAGAITLARGGQIAALGDWTRSLMDLFPAFPDGAVLWAESLRVAREAGNTAPFGQADPLRTIAETILALATKGVPFFNESSELAVEILDYLRLRRSSLPHPVHVELGRVRRMFRRVFEISRPSGQFLMVTAGPDATGAGPLTPESIRAALRPRAHTAR